MAGAGHSGSQPGAGLVPPARPLGTGLVGAGLWGHPGQVKRHIGQKWQLQEALGEPGWGGSSQPWAAPDPCDCPQTRGSARMASNLPPRTPPKRVQLSKARKSRYLHFSLPNPCQTHTFLSKGLCKAAGGSGGLPGNGWFDQKQQSLGNPRLFPFWIWSEEVLWQCAPNTVPPASTWGVTIKQRSWYPCVMHQELIPFFGRGSAGSVAP